MTDNQKQPDLKYFLDQAIKAGASDIHLKPGMPPIIRVNGALKRFKDEFRLTPDRVLQLAITIMNKEIQEKFAQKNEVDFAYGMPGLGRFRVNIYKQRGSISIVLRIIPFAITSLKELNLPEAIAKIASELNGLILVTGTTGSGKSTTLAAMIDLINSKRTSHIITIEDPIEFLHRDKKGIISQREVGSDTESFAIALKYALRQDPDVIMVGEMRDFETINTAISAAETGHLVLSTLHTIDATETISRIITEFPERQQQQVRLQLGAIIKGIISQKLVPKANGKGRVPAVEILVNTLRIREYIEDKDKTKGIREAIAEGYVQTFDQSLMILFKAGLITLEEALLQCTNRSDFKLQVQGISGSHDAKTWGESTKEAPSGNKGDGDKAVFAFEGDGLDIERF